MGSMVMKYKTMLPVRNLAVQITSGVAGKDWRGEVQAIQDWVKSNIRYVRDIRDVETLHTPDVILQIRAGDCDDQSALVAILLKQSVIQPALSPSGSRPMSTIMCML